MRSQPRVASSQQLVAWVLAASALLGPEAGADLQQIQARGSLRVLVAGDEDPEMFSFASSGAPGLEREAVEAFARAQHLRLELIKLDAFGQAIPLLLLGKGDVIMGIVDTAARRQQIAFTRELLPIRHVVVTRRPLPRVSGLPELRVARVGVISGSSWADAALDAGVPVANLTAYPEMPALLEGLEAGQVQATVMTVVQFGLAQRHQPALEAGLLVGSPGRACWGVRPADTQLQAALSRHLATLCTSEAWGRMVMRYFTPELLELLARARKP